MRFRLRPITFLSIGQGNQARNGIEKLWAFAVEFACSCEHSLQAYIIIKRIHLMNCAKPDTLAAIMRIQRPEAAGAWGVLVSFSFSRFKNKIRRHSCLERSAGGKNLFRSCPVAAVPLCYEANLVR
jgi:hypothetical protein